MHSNLWKDFGCICAFFVLFLLVAALGLELQRPNSGKGATTIFKHGKGPALDSDMAGFTAQGPGSRESRPERVTEFVDGPSSPPEQVIHPKTATGLTWSQLDYSIKPRHLREPKKVLSDQQGYLRPGSLTALMGASGAGKTTLLNALAQRLQTGRVQGMAELRGSARSC